MVEGIASEIVTLELWYTPLLTPSMLETKIDLIPMTMSFMSRMMQVTTSSPKLYRDERVEVPHVSGSVVDTSSRDVLPTVTLWLPSCTVMVALACIAVGGAKTQEITIGSPIVTTSLATRTSMNADVSRLDVLI